MLRAVVNEGTGGRVRRLGVKADMGGKTGTTNYNADGLSLIHICETAFETEIDRSFLAVSGMLFVGSTGHNRSLSPHPVSYTHLTPKPADN